MIHATFRWVLLVLAATLTPIIVSAQGASPSSEHGWDPYLGIGILLVVVKELAMLARMMYQRSNGGSNPGHGNTSGAKAIWTEMNRIRDTVERTQETLTDLRERVSRLEWRQGP